jgi:hypothetical protein
MNKSLCLLVCAGLLFFAPAGILAEDLLPQTGLSAPASVPDPAEAQKARQALDEFIRAYETGNIGLLRNLLDPGMLGYQRFIDGMIQDGNRLKQIRLHLMDTQTMAGTDVALIQVRWEKRFLSVSELKPGLFSGQSQFLMHRSAAGWRMAAVAGDNPFSSQSGVLAQLSLSPVFLPDNAAVNVQIIDPDMAGAGLLTAQLTHVHAETTLVTTSQVTLQETTPGRFQSMSPFVVGLGMATLRYLDSNPGDGRPPSLLTRTIRVP